MNRLFHPPLAQLGDSEIEHFNNSIRPDNHIVRFDVAMNNFTGVSRRQRAGNLYRNINSSIQIKSADHHLLAKGRPLDKFGSNKMHSIRLPEFINCKNVRVIQSRSRMCFVFKATQTALIASDFWRKHFERDLSSESHILGQVNLAHAASSEQGNYFVMRQLSAGSNNCGAAFRHHLMSRFKHRPMQEVHRFLCGSQKGLYFLSQLPITRAILFEEVRTRLW